jgi:hypothetical protein
VIQLLETIHDKKNFWLIFEGTEILGKFDTKEEAIKVAKDKYGYTIIFTTQGTKSNH